jgi:hypothetical protein
MDTTTYRYRKTHTRGCGLYEMCFDKAFSVISIIMLTSLTIFSCCTPFFFEKYWKEGIETDLGNNVELSFLSRLRALWLQFLDLFFLAPFYFVLMAGGFCLSCCTANYAGQNGNITKIFDRVMRLYEVWFNIMEFLFCRRLDIIFQIFNFLSGCNRGGKELYMHFGEVKRFKSGFKCTYNNVLQMTFSMILFALVLEFYCLSGFNRKFFTLYWNRHSENLSEHTKLLMDNEGITDNNVGNIAPNPPEIVIETSKQDDPCVSVRRQPVPFDFIVELPIELECRIQPNRIIDTVPSVIVGIIGTSQCGKTCLLNSLIHAEEPKRNILVVNDHHQGLCGISVNRSVFVEYSGYTIETKNPIFMNSVIDVADILIMVIKCRDYKEITRNLWENLSAFESNLEKLPRKNNAYIVFNFCESGSKEALEKEWKEITSTFGLEMELRTFGDISYLKKTSMKTRNSILYVPFGNETICVSNNTVNTNVLNLILCSVTNAEAGSKHRTSVLKGLAKTIHHQFVNHVDSVSPTYSLSDDCKIMTVFIGD